MWDSLVPLDNLSIGIVVASSAHWQIVGVDKGTNRVTTLSDRKIALSETLPDEKSINTHEISTVGVKLAAEIVGSQVDESLIEMDQHLKVRRRLQELNTGDSASRDETGTVTGLRAPCDFLAFGVTDSGGAGGRSPEAPVCRRFRIRII